MDNPHVVILPFPAQGHIKPMLMLAELLSRADFTITFVNTEQSHRRLTDGASFRRRCPGINFLSIPDGLPPDHPRSGPSIIDLLISTSSACKPIFKDLIASMSQSHAPPTCIISDGIMSFSVDVAAELGIPAIAFRTYNATSTWTYFHLEKLIQEGEIPVVEGSEEIDRLICCIPGLESILRRRDLPMICRLVPESESLQFFITQASKMSKASALILNTFEELESPILSHLRSIFPAVYAIGPLHSAVNSTVAHPPPPDSSSSLLQIDQSCMDWLDSQPSNSVLYVSFGSVAWLTRDELMEFWYGLVNSEQPFLWAIRPDLIWDGNGSDMIPEELKRSTMERGRIVGWAPQEEVLAHDAVGGFLTHCGWNSILESICAGKPMICRPMVSEQQVNGRCVSEMWKLGLDMNCFCDRSTVERVVRDLMEGGRKEEMLRSTAEIARLAKDCVSDGGSSHTNLNKLIADIKILHSKVQN
ncbi:hypothetical protein C2S53_012513 [Perilla frutescens var. hirtella]|uniref:Glycosyltransferase n=1 Tax=Perilla frutescens var. hirtella TaxID=608512 RepID=A0AAD4P889_PERFH|nr:hypothetical protein C2S53_012513 [Perilla frutescens var. hirtella]